MKKVISILVMSLILSVTVGLAPCKASDLPEVKKYTIAPTKLFVNDQKIQSRSLIIGKGTTYVPLRMSSEVLNLNVNWNGEDREITVSNNLALKSTHKIKDNKLNIDDIYWATDVTLFILDKDGDKQKIETPLILLNNSTYIPLRALSEALNIKVEWDGINKEIKLKKYLYIGKILMKNSEKITLKNSDSKEEVYIKIPKNSYEKLITPSVVGKIYGQKKLLLKLKTNTYNFNIHVFGEDERGENVLIAHNFIFPYVEFKEYEIDIDGYRKVHFRIYPTNNKQSKLTIKPYIY